MAHDSDELILKYLEEAQSRLKKIPSLPKNGRDARQDANLHSGEKL